MAKELPPYVNATGLLQELLKKIREAPPPPRFSQDFLFTNLKFTKSGSTVAFIPFLKRIGFLANDGTPTDVYKKFRNPNSKISGQAVAQAMKTGYPDLYSRNEYWHNLGKEDLKNFLIEVLEVEAKNTALKSLISTLEILKKTANFDQVEENEKNDEEGEEVNKQKRKHSTPTDTDIDSINLSYTINLNLPETSDVAVFDAIFKSLKENLLKK